MKGNFFMELDSINRIFQTEKQAEEIKEQARKQAEKLIQNAIESKPQKEVFAKKRIDVRKQVLEQKAKDDNAEEIRRIAEITEQKCKQIEEKAIEKMQDAVDAVFKEVIN